MRLKLIPAKPPKPLAKGSAMRRSLELCKNLWFIYLLLLASQPLVKLFLLGFHHCFKT
jgi:hypothetical protein